MRIRGASISSTELFMRCSLRRKWFVSCGCGRTTRKGLSLMTDRRQRLFGGVVSTLAGLLTAAVIYLHPENLHAPAWVAYAACAAFVFAGLTIMAYEFALHRIHVWLAVACMAALLVPGAWVAFGPGARKCSVALPSFSTVGSDLLCRGAFGIGAIVVAALLVWVVLRALRQQNAVNPSVER